MTHLTSQHEGYHADVVALHVYVRIIPLHCITLMTSLKNKSQEEEYYKYEFRYCAYTYSVIVTILR